MELTLREKQCSLQSPIFCIWLCLQPDKNTTFKRLVLPSAAHFQQCNYHSATFFTFQRFTLPPAYLYQKDERVQSENLQISECISLCNNAVSLTTVLIFLICSSNFALHYVPSSKFLLHACWCVPLDTDSSQLNLFLWRPPNYLPNLYNLPFVSKFRGPNLQPLILLMQRRLLPAATLKINGSLVAVQVL